MEKMHETQTLVGSWRLMVVGRLNFTESVDRKITAAWKGPTDSWSRFSIDPDGDILDLPGGWVHATVRDFLKRLGETPRPSQTQEQLETMVGNGDKYWKKFMNKPPDFDPDDLVCGRIGTNEGTGLYFLGDSSPTSKQYKAIVDFLSFLEQREKYTPSQRGIKMFLDTGGMEAEKFNSVTEAKDYVSEAFGKGKLKKQKIAPVQSLVQQFHMGKDKSVLGKWKRTK